MATQRDVKRDEHEGALQNHGLTSLRKADRNLRTTLDHCPVWEIVVQRQALGVLRQDWEWWLVDTDTKPVESIKSLQECFSMLTFLIRLWLVRAQCTLLAQRVVAGRERPSQNGVALASKSWHIAGRHRTNLDSLRLHTSRERLYQRTLTS